MERGLQMKDKVLAHWGAFIKGEIMIILDISEYLLNDNIIPPNKDPNPIRKDSYAGGYLFCPKTGIFNYMFDEDLTSLYPSIIMTNNIGRESLVGRILPPLFILPIFFFKASYNSF